MNKECSLVFLENVVTVRNNLCQLYFTLYCPHVAGMSLPPFFYYVFFLQYSLTVLPCSGGTALPFCMAAHFYPRAALGNAWHRLHPNSIHRRPAVYFSTSAHRIATGGGQSFSIVFGNYELKPESYIVHRFVTSIHEFKDVVQKYRLCVHRF